MGSEGGALGDGLKLRVNLYKHGYSRLDGKGGLDHLALQGDGPEHRFEIVGGVAGCRAPNC